jgi:cbb3-type cytochrome oxidase subunit 3
MNFPVALNTLWGGKRYNGFNRVLKETFGARVYKIGLRLEFTCPNRDGTVAVGGCIYCNNASHTPETYRPRVGVTEQLRQGAEALRMLKPQEVRALHLRRALRGFLARPGCNDRRRFERRRVDVPIGTHEERQLGDRPKPARLEAYPRVVDAAGIAQGTPGILQGGLRFALMYAGKLPLGGVAHAAAGAVAGELGEPPMSREVFLGRGDEALAESNRNMRLNGLEHFAKIMLPAAVPSMFTGMRIGVMYVLVTVVAMAAFFGIVWWAYAPSRRSLWERRGLLEKDEA